MGAVETVKIVSEVAKQGYIIINESDFDKRTQKLYKESEPKPAKEKLEEVKEKVPSNFKRKKEDK